MTGQRVAFWLISVSAAYIAVCIPAIFIAEAYHFPEWPMHVSQFVAVLVFVVSGWFYVLGSPKSSEGVLQRRLVSVGLVCALLWLAFIVFAGFFVSFGPDD
jgi:hypothetical protein